MFTEKQIDIHLANSSDGDGVYEALLSAIKAVDPNIDCEFTVSTLKKNRMSWRLFEEEAVDFLGFEQFVALFGANNGVSHEQWKSIYEAMKKHVHQNGDVLARKHLAAVHANFYKLWFLKCIETLFSLCFSCLSTYISLCVLTTGSSNRFSHDPQ